MPHHRPLRAFGTLSFTYFASLGLYNPYAPLWFKSLGFGALAIGTIASIQSWTRVIAPYAWSWLGDHGAQRVALVRIAAAGTLLATLALWFVRDFWPVALAAMVMFVFNAGIVPLSEAALSRHLTTGQIMDAGRYGRIRVWGSIGFVVSVTAAGALLQSAGIDVLPYAVSALCGLLLLAALRLPAAHDEAHHESAAPPVLPTLRRPEVAWFFASVFFTVLAHTSVYAFFSLYLDALGYGKVAVGALWALAVGLEIGFFWFQGRWFDRLSARGWLKLAAGVSALRFAAMALAGQWVGVLMLAQASHAITFAAHHAACTVVIHRHFPGRLRARGQALYSMLGYGVPGVIGGVGGGWLIGRLGYAAVFWAASLAALAGLACAFRAARVPASQVPKGMPP